MAITPRLRGVIVAGAALAVIAAVGVGVSFAKPATQTRYVTATAGTGDVTQTYTSTGAITRTNTAEASFAVDGTVGSVKVAVGDTVDAGEVLAVLKKGPLQLAALEAETSVAEAKAALYSALHPSGPSSRTGSAGSGSAGSGSSGSGSGSRSGSGSGGRTVTIDPTVLIQATTAISTAVAAEQVACAPVFGSIPQPTATATATVSTSPSTTPSASSSPTPTPSESASQTPSGTPSTTPWESPAPTVSQTPTETASHSRIVKDQSDTIEANDPTAAELKACGEARAQVKLATANLQTVVQRLLVTGSKPSGGTSGGSSAQASGSSAASSSSTPTVSAAQVASARAKLLQAEQALQSAQDDLDGAELVAPISGTVGTVGVSAGNSSSAASVTIVGEGNAQVSLQLPLKTRTLVKAGQKVTVTPAGSTRNLPGILTGISAIETSGTAGASPTYTTLVTVSDSGGLLASGAKASVTIPMASATGVVRLPASAVTPTGSGTATVQVLGAGSTTATSVEVTTGAVGGGWVQITKGITAGQSVVLADTTADLPTNSNNRRTTSTTRASASPSAGSQPGGESTTRASAAPSASPSR